MTNDEIRKLGDRVLEGFTKAGLLTTQDAKFHIVAGQWNVNAAYVSVHSRIAFDRDEMVNLPEVLKDRLQLELSRMKDIIDHDLKLLGL